MKADNLFGESMRKRPERYGERVFELAAQLLAARLRREFPADFAETENDGDEGLVAQLREALESNRDGDGYGIAKSLDDRGMWEVDAQLVEALDGGCLSDAYEELLLEWAATEGLQPMHGLGDHVAVRPLMTREGKIERVEAVGEIVGIDTQRATYTVCLPSFGHVKSGTGVHGVVMAWEDVDG